MGLTQQEQPAVANPVTEIPWARAIFVGYILVLFASAFTRDFFVIPFASHHLSGIGAAFVEPLWKIVFWLTPTFVYVRFVLKEKPLIYLKLTMNVRQGLIWGVGLSIFVIVLFAFTPVLKFGGIQLPHSFDDWLNVVILVGVLEEIPFRGVVFQQLQTWMGFWSAALLSSVLFMAVHIPLWLATGDRIFLANPALSMVTIFAFGVAMCYLLKRSGSLWSCILVHSAYDFTTFF